MFGAIASIAGSALGFIGASKANKAAKQQAAADRRANSPQGIRKNAEEAGFNPLTVLNSGRQFGAGYSPQFQNALGQIGRGIEDYVSGREQIKIQKAELELERKRVDALMKATTFGPPKPGVYGRTIGAKGSVENAGQDNSSLSGRVSDTRNSAGYRDNATPELPSDPSRVDPRRERQYNPVVSGAGVTEIDNPWLGGTVYLPGDDGEPWGIDEVATGVVVGLPQVMYKHSKPAEALTYGPRRPKISAKEAQEIRKKRKRDAKKDPWWNFQIYD